MRKKLSLLLLCALLPLSGIFAQSGGGSTYDYFSFNFTLMPGFDLPAFDDPGIHSSFAINGRLAPKLSAGAEVILGASSPLFTVKYEVADLVRVGFTFGRLEILNFFTLGNYAGFDLEYLAFKNKSAMSTELALGMRYFFNMEDMTSGKIMLAIKLGLGA
jgi:hypothetical protein